MKNSFRQEIDSRLSGLDWHGEMEVLRRIRAPRKKAKRRALILVTALLMLLCLTAAALTLAYSARYSLQHQARDVLFARYGLTGEMLDLFQTQWEETEEGTALHFVPVSLRPDAMGVYTVLRTPAGAFRAAWSHDGQEVSPEAALDAPVWGPGQLERALRLRRENAEAWRNAAYDQLTLEERAALDAPLLAGAEAAPYINIAPAAGDLLPAEAEKRARAAIARKYGRMEEELAAWSVQLSFQLSTAENVRYYRFLLEAPEENAGAYRVWIPSPGGETALCQWLVDAEYRTLPAGNLEAFYEAAQEYMQSGAFDLLSAEEKARTAARLTAAGLGGLLPAEDYLVPERADLSEEMAREKAREALNARYGLSAADLSRFFAVRSALLLGEGQRVWQLQYTPVEQPNFRWRDFDKLGVYTVHLNAETGGVLSCTWSGDGMELAAYTEETFAAAPAYSAPMLSWVDSLLSDLQAILDRYPPDTNLGELSLEDDAAYAARMRRAGYTPRYDYVLPGENALSPETAAALARQALTTEYGLDERALKACAPRISCIRDFRQGDASEPFWVLNFDLNCDVYTVWVFADTGLVDGIYHDSPASGNG